jgi:hypothetical protein
MVRFNFQSYRYKNLKLPDARGYYQSSIFEKEANAAELLVTD